MKKLVVSIFVILFIIFSCIPVFAYDVETPLERPVPLYNDDGSNIHIILYWVFYQSNTYYMACLNAYYPINTHFYISGSTFNSMYRTDQQPNSGTITTYNLATGNIVTTENANGVLINDTIGNLSTPNYFKWVNNTQGNGFFPDNANFHLDVQGAEKYSVNWYEPKGDVIRSNIPQPLADFTHYYFADDTTLFQIHLNYPFYLQSIGTSVSPLYAEEFFESIFVNLSKRDVNTLTIDIHNRSQHACTGYLNQYDIITGEYITGFSFSVPSADTTDGIYTYYQPVNNANVNGIWYTGFVNTDGLVEFDKLQISWSDTIDYKVDFVTIETLLGNIQNEVLSIGNDVGNIYSYLQLLKASIDNVYQLLNNYFSWFKSTFYSTITGKWDITNNYLLSIYNLLNETESTIAINDDMSAVDEMESAKDELKITNSYGQEIDPGEAAQEVFSNASVELGNLASPISTINNLMQNMIFSKPKLLLPLIVALSLGLLVTIIGKNKSD